MQSTGSGSSTQVLSTMRSTAVCVWPRPSPNGKKHATKSTTGIMDLYIGPWLECAGKGEMA